MAGLSVYASSSDKYLVFDGRRLHKKAFGEKGKASNEDAALIAGVIESLLSNADAEAIKARMEHVKKGFRSYIRHYISSWWVDNAIALGVLNRKTGRVVQSYQEMVEELESNSTMRNFQNWYNICYKETDCKMDGKTVAEARIMNDLKLKYTDETITGGCVGKLLSDLLNKELGKLQGRSRNKQRLHLVKSRPAAVTEGGKSKKRTAAANDSSKSRKNGVRRSAGEYFVVRSNGSGDPLDWTGFNVSENARLVFCCGWDL
jgi:hypothetical protein